MKRGAPLTATVVILTYNGERFIDDILTALDGQRFDGVFDTLVIDSGSTDRTLELVAAHPGVRLHVIPNEEFGHGRTRNLGAQLATGDIVAYLTHDAVPLHEGWLAEIVAPFADDPRIAAVLGKQVPRRSAPPALKYDIQRVFERLGPDYGLTVVFDSGQGWSNAERTAAAFYSDANSAARREVLLGPVPYRDVAYAEDQVFGRDLLDRGFRKAYAPRATVEHSNDVTLRTFGKRVADDVVGLRRIGVAIAPVGRLAGVKQFVKWSLADAAAIILDHDYSVLRKAYWLVVNPLYHATKWASYRRATRIPIRSEPC
jgi:rhamnosyltransferase